MKLPKILPVFICLLICFSSVLADVEPYGSETHIQSDPEPLATDWNDNPDRNVRAPQQDGLLSNPLDYAAGRIGLDVRGIELPRGHEGAYRFACRFPIIDYVSNRPLYMKQWTEDNSLSKNSSLKTRYLCK